MAILRVLDSIGVKLIEVSLPDFPSNALSFILSAEAAAAFDELTRSNRDDELVRQVRNAWPNVFRAARFIPAVEYINANRARGILIDRMYESLKGVDVVITPSFGGPQLQMTNLTGHPALVMPYGYSNNGSPTSITIIGQLFGEADVVRVAAEIQKHTTYHKGMPPKFAVK
jgi:Asp-tRNA(Asn)/Glu-tRNA(Gln) amidotransferase A subunit family amidase